MKILDIFKKKPKYYIQKHVITSNNEVVDTYYTVYKRGDYGGTVLVKNGKYYKENFQNLEFSKELAKGLNSRFAHTDRIYKRVYCKGYDVYVFFKGDDYEFCIPKGNIDYVDQDISAKSLEELYNLIPDIKENIEKVI